MKYGLIALLFGTASILSGCLSVDHAVSDVTHEEHVVVRDFGWRLFNAIPIFRSEITQDRVQKELLSYAATKGKRAEDLVYNNYDTVMFNMPLIAFTVPVPYIICYREIQLSAVLRTK